MLLQMLQAFKDVMTWGGFGKGNCLPYVPSLYIRAPQSGQLVPWAQKDSVQNWVGDHAATVQDGDTGTGTAVECASYGS
jgi:hypothetical protein